MARNGKRHTTQNNGPAVLGGRPMFDKPVAITRPTIPSISDLKNDYGRILKSGIITNAGYVREFEQKLSQYLGVKNVVAVSSCTSGLMLVLKVLGLKGEVIVPSFTFHSTAHAIVWAGLKPVFVDCDAETFNIDPEKVKKAITSKTAAILAVHIFGNPCPIKPLERIAKEHGLPLIFDAAHGFGATYAGHRLGRFGKVEVFSLSPTKLLTAGEGGVVATNDDKLAEKIRIGRNYGDPGTYECEFSGFNARMSEFHALLGISTLGDLEKNVVKRRNLVVLYKSLLADFPGISFQKIEPGNRSSFKDFSILVEREKFGLDRDMLGECLKQENIMVKKYFYPPVHTQMAFIKYRYKKYLHSLTRTNMIAENILSLPLYSHMSEAYVRRICSAIEKIYHNKIAIKDIFAQSGKEKKLQ